MLWVPPRLPSCAVSCVHPLELQGELNATLYKIKDISEEAENKKVKEPPKIAELKKALDSGFLDPRTAMGQKFTRDCQAGDPDTEGYDQCRGLKAKRAFKLKWSEKNRTARCH